MVRRYIRRTGRRIRRRRYGRLNKRIARIAHRVEFKDKETKIQITSAGPTAIPDGTANPLAVTWNLDSIVQGVDVNQRIGNEIQVKSISLHAYFNLGTSTVSKQRLVTMWLLMPRKSVNGFETINSGDFSTPGPLGIPNIYRFVVLKRWSFCLEIGPNLGGHPSSKVVVWSKRWRQKPSYILGTVGREPILAVYTNGSDVFFNSTRRITYKD